MPGGKTGYGARAALDWLLGGSSPTRPTTRRVALLTQNPSDDAMTGLAEVSTGVWTNYARPAATFGAATGDSPASSTTTADTDFGTATTTGDVKITGYAIYDAISAGNPLYWEWIGGTVQAVTAVAATDVFTKTAHGYADGTAIVFKQNAAGAALPGGITQGLVYYVRDSTANTFKVATTPGGTAVDVTVDGSADMRTVNIVQNGNPVKFPTGSLTCQED